MLTALVYNRTVPLTTCTPIRVRGNCRSLIALAQVHKSGSRGLMFWAGFGGLSYPSFGVSGSSPCFTYICSNSIWHLFWHTFWNICVLFLAFNLASLLTFCPAIFLAVYLASLHVFILAFYLSSSFTSLAIRAFKQQHSTRQFRYPLLPEGQAANLHTPQTQDISMTATQAYIRLPRKACSPQLSWSAQFTVGPLF